MLARLFAVFLLVAAPLAAAAAPTAPSELPLGVDRYVYAELAFTQPTFTRMDVSGTLWLYRHDVGARVYDADQLSGAALGSNPIQGGSSGSAFIAQLEGAVRDAVAGMLQTSFPGSTVSGVTAMTDRASLAAPNGNPFDPPVRVTIGAQVDRTLADLGLGTLSEEAVEAALAAGARVANEMVVAVDTGYRIVYTVTPPASPAGLRFAAGEGVAGDGSRLTLDVDNTLAAAPSRAATAYVYDETVTPPTGEEIETFLDLSMGELTSGGAGIPVQVLVRSSILSLDAAKRFPDALPAGVQLAFVNADGVRALKATGAITEGDVAAAEDALLAGVRDDLARIFGEAPVVTGGLDDAELARPTTKPYGTSPPLPFTAFSNATYALDGVSVDDVEVALRIGAAATVDLTLVPAGGHATTYAFHPPVVATISGAEGGEVSANGETATFRVPAGAQRQSASLSLRGADVPSFEETDANVHVTVDIQDIAISTGEALSGGRGELIIEITVDASLSVIDLPAELQGSLPEQLDLERLSADGIRLLVEGGHVTPANLSSLERSLSDKVAQKLGATLGGEFPVDGAFLPESFSIDLVSDPISGDEPIVFRASAHIVKPLAGGEAQTQAAIALYTQSLPLTLPKIEGLDTTYIIIAPPGLAFTGADGGEIGEAPDGRSQVTMSPGDQPETVTLSMAVTPTFVVAKFWPLVLGAVILLVLLVGTPIALVVRARAKKAK